METTTQQPQAGSRSAFIALVGKPNVGKSSLLNRLVGEKVAIVTQKPQTTRTRITGVLTKEETQLVFIDTPGLLKAKDALGRYMVKQVNDSVADVDGVCLLVEPIAKLGAPEQELIDRLREEKLPAVLVINKIDTVEKAQLLEVMAAYSGAYPFDAIIPVSAQRRDGLDVLMGQLEKYAAEGPQLFPDGMTTDQPERQIVGEIVREKLLRNLDKEVPHGTAVELTRFSERENGILDLEATIYCEKSTHKGIIIGKQGSMLKKISTMAREDMERLLGAKVYLETWVKVKEQWRDNLNLIRSLGFDSRD